MKKEEKRKEIRDVFLYYLKMYKKKGFDDYSASQMAALGTRIDYKLSKNELIRILNNE